MLETRFVRRASYCLALVLAPGAALAQEPPKPREFTADIGYVSTSGNTDVSTFNLGERLVLRAGAWKHKQQFGSVYASQDGEQTSNLLFANWRSDWTFRPALALFGYLGFDRNEFAGIARRFEQAVGLAATLPTISADEWTLELGLAANQQRGTDGRSQNFASVRSASYYKHVFSKSAYFEQGVEFLPSLKVSDDYRVNTESALVAPISSNIAMKFAYVVRFDNLPEPGREKSDRIVTAGLQFNW